MINEKKFDEVLKEYNKEMNVKRSTEGWMDLSELKLREKLTEEIVVKNNGEAFNLVASNIADLIKKEDYRELHEELQRVFNESIPFMTIRRFVGKVCRYGVNLVCHQVNDLKDLSYSDTMCQIKYPSDLLRYLCDIEEEIKVYDDIYIKYNSDWNRMTDYRKSRIKRNIGQVSAECLKHLVDSNDINALKDTLQKMFSDFIDDIDIIEFLNRVKDGLDINKILDLHRKYSLEKFHCLLLIVE